MTESQQQEEQTTERDPLTDALAEVDALKDKYLRAVAEMQNIQKRAQRDVEDAGKYAVTSAAKPFLGVADNLARALNSLPPQMEDGFKNFAEGVRATQRELQSALERMGVTAIVPKQGDALNPHEHEVMFEVPGDGHANGTIVQVLDAGYKIHDRLLRPARVSVAKASAPAGVDFSA